MKARDMATTYLTFCLNREVFALPLACVSEIATHPERIARVPGAPHWLRGMFNLRGSEVPAIDLASKLGFEPTTRTQRTCLLMVPFAQGSAQVQLGLIVAEVGDLIVLDDDEIEPAEPSRALLHAEWLLGTAGAQGEIVSVLDWQRMFREEELLAAARAREPVQPADLDRMSTQAPAQEDTDPALRLL